MKTDKVLVFPRSIFNGAVSLLSWDLVRSRLGEIEASFSWMNRAEAERSLDLVQAIPCTFILDENGRYCVLRRVANGRSDLSRKLSLIVGGHMDYCEDHDSFRGAMFYNLMRELEEEVGVIPIECPHPIGVIIDGASIEASRHVAFLHATMAERVSPKAPEEFSSRSKSSGEYLLPSQLAKKRDEFDPWSRTLIEEYVCPELHRQLSLL